MRKTKAVAYGDGSECIVKELTGLEIDQLFDDAEAASPTTFDNLLDGHDLNGSILAMMCGLEARDLERQLMALPPSTWSPLIAAAKEVNPDFFDLARRLRHRAELIANMGKILGSNSAEPSLLLSSPATTMPGVMEFR